MVKKQIILNDSPYATIIGEGEYEYGSPVVIDVIVDDDYEFLRLEDSEGNIISSKVPYTFIIKSDKHLKAIIMEKNQIVKTITATPNVGWEFKNWTVGDEVLSTQATYSFTPIEDMHIIGNFNKKVFNVEITVDGIGTVTGAGEYEFQDEVTLVATPEEGNAFVGWFTGPTSEELVSENLTYTFNVENNISLVAKFKRTVFNVTVEAVPVEGGSVEINE